MISENLFWHRSQSMLGPSCSTPPLLLSGLEAPQPIGPGCTQPGNNLFYAALTRKTRAARKDIVPVPVNFTQHTHKSSKIFTDRHNNFRFSETIVYKSQRTFSKNLRVDCLLHCKLTHTHTVRIYVLCCA